MARIAMTLAVPDLTGASRMLFYFARALQNRGHEVVVIHGKPPTDENGAIASVVTELDALGIETKQSSLLRRPIPPFVYSQVRRLIDRCDAVIGINQRDRAVALRVAKSLNAVGILSIQNQHNFWGPLFVPKLKRHYYAKTLCQHGDRMVCSSQTTVEEVIAFGVKPERCSLLLNGIQMRPKVLDCERGQAREELGIGDNQSIFVNVGRLDIQKGQDLLLEAWFRREAPTPNEQLWLIGDITEGNQAARSTEFKKSLQATCENHPDSAVKFQGWRNDVSKILAAADCYLHSARWEGYPLSVMEAMSAGLPTVYTDCSGYPENFQNGRHGFIVPAGNIDARNADGVSLVDAINRLRSMDDAARAAMSDLARTYSEENFDIEVVGKRFAEIVEEEIARKRPSQDSHPVVEIL